jgi:hypothetical protein
LVRRSVIELKKRVDELRKQYSQARSCRGYLVEAQATRRAKSATNPHHRSIEPSIPPQMAVILYIHGMSRFEYCQMYWME